MKNYNILNWNSKSLNRDARIFIYLPDNYKKTDQRYPVLYMHDGQNIMDDETASFGESWRIIDAFKEKKLPEMIVVGIECAEGINRLNEYTAWDNFDIKNEIEWIEEDIIGKADLYLEFLVYDLKPYIDDMYRTLSDAKNTMLMGSSMGGLITTYAMTKYQNIFSKFGALSNAFFVSQKEILKCIKNSNFDNVEKFYMDIGTNEFSSTVPNKNDYIKCNQEVYEEIAKKISPDRIRFDIIEGAIHSEVEWRKRFPKIIEYLTNKAF